MMRESFEHANCGRQVNSSMLTTAVKREHFFGAARGSVPGMTKRIQLEAPLGRYVLVITTRIVSSYQPARCNNQTSHMGLAGAHPVPSALY